MNKPSIFKLVCAGAPIPTFVNILYHNKIGNNVVDQLMIKMNIQLNIHSFLSNCKSSLNDTVLELVIVKQYE